MRLKDSLQVVIREALKNGMEIYIDTNGFWGKSKQFAKEIFDDHQGTAFAENGIIVYALSVDKYHYDKVKPKAIKNLIQVFALGNYPNLRMGISTFGDDESWRDAIGGVFKECHKDGVYLVEGGDQTFIYPALKEELVEFKESNYPIILNILKELGVSAELSRESILNNIALFKRVHPKELVARQFDIGEGFKPYLVFPKPEKLISLEIIEKPIMAGRAKNEPSFLVDKDEVTPYLIITSTGAYMRPSQIIEGKKRVSYSDKDIQTVIAELFKKNVVS